MNEEVRARRARRAEFLVRLYTHAGSDVRVFVDALEIGEALGAGPDEMRRILAYHEELGHIRVDDYRAGLVRLTAGGVDRAETWLLDGSVRAEPGSAGPVERPGPLEQTADPDGPTTVGAPRGS